MNVNSSKTKLTFHAMCHVKRPFLIILSFNLLEVNEIISTSLIKLRILIVKLKHVQLVKSSRSNFLQ